MIIFREKDFISKEDQEFILNKINSDDVWPKISYLIDSRQSNILKDDGSTSLKKLFEVVNLYNKKTADYLYKNNLLSNNIYCVNPSIYRYKKGYSLLPHKDDSWVKYSSIIYLNKDYYGGELNFIDLNISIKPEEKEMILFEQGHLHEVDVVREGTRLTITNWWTDVRQDLDEMIEYHYDL